MVAWYSADGRVIAEAVWKRRHFMNYIDEIDSASAGTFTTRSMILSSLQNVLPGRKITIDFTSIKGSNLLLINRNVNDPQYPNETILYQNLTQQELDKIKDFDKNTQINIADQVQPNSEVDIAMWDFGVQKQYVVIYAHATPAYANYTYVNIYYSYDCVNFYTLFSSSYQFEIARAIVNARCIKLSFENRNSTVTYSMLYYRMKMFEIYEPLIIPPNNKIELNSKRIVTLGPQFITLDNSGYADYGVVYTTIW